MDRLHVQRIEEINKVIDSHFLLIKDFILQSKISKRDLEIQKAEFVQKYEKQIRITRANEYFDNDPELRFEEYDQLLKLKKLD